MGTESRNECGEWNNDVLRVKGEGAQCAQGSDVIIKNYKYNKIILSLNVRMGIGNMNGW